MKLTQFYDLKEPQKTFRFRVSFDDSGKYKPDGETMPVLVDFDVANISLPTYSFKKEVQKYGNFPRTFPVLDHDGFEISVLFEETKDHRVGRFVNWLQRKIIQQDGIYNPPDLAKFDNMFVEVLTDFDEVVAKYQFPNVYFLRLQPVVYDYSTNEITRYEVIFGADIQNMETFVETLPIGILDNLRNVSSSA